MNAGRLLAKRGATALVITSYLLSDGFVFCSWVLIALGCQEASTFAASKGLHEVFASIFKWASSISTLALAIAYVIADIVAAIRYIQKIYLNKGDASDV